MLAEKLMPFLLNEYFTMYEALDEEFNDSEENSCSQIVLLVLVAVLLFIYGGMVIYSIITGD